MKKPSFWKGMSFTAKAGYLTATRQARNYSEACAMLAAQPRRKKTTPAPVVARLPYVDS
jgi:hypothetical protein